MMRTYRVSKKEALIRIIEKYEEQTEFHPMMRDRVPLQDYIQTNLRCVRQYNWLAGYPKRKGTN